MPGHSSILALSKPDVTTSCPGHAGYGLDRENLNPTNASTYEYIRKLYSDVLPRFPDSYVHLGGGALPQRCLCPALSTSLFGLRHHTCANSSDDSLKQETR